MRGRRTLLTRAAALSSLAMIHHCSQFVIEITRGDRSQAQFCVRAASIHPRDVLQSAAAGRCSRALHRERSAAHRRSGETPATVTPQLIITSNGERLGLYSLLRQVAASGHTPDSITKGSETGRTDERTRPKSDRRHCWASPRSPYDKTLLCPSARGCQPPSQS